jgi:hypothetical protein
MVIMSFQMRGMMKNLSFCPSSFDNRLPKRHPPSLSMLLFPRHCYQPGALITPNRLFTDRLLYGYYDTTETKTWIPAAVRPVFPA